MELKKNLILLFLFLIIIPLTLADMGPKPTMGFDFDFQSANITIQNGILLQCQDSECINSSPLQEVGPQRFECEETRCYALAYGFSPYQKLVINFSDKQRESNVFSEPTGMSGQYLVIVEPDILRVNTSIKSEDYSFIFALIITLVVELGIAYLFLFFKKLPKKILWSVLIANIITLSLFWGGYSILDSFAFLVLFILWWLIEAIIIPLEATIIYFSNNKEITFLQSLGLSALTNLGSIAIGYVIWMFFAVISIFIETI